MSVAGDDYKSTSPPTGSLSALPLSPDSLPGQRSFGLTGMAARCFTAVFVRLCVRMVFVVSQDDYLGAVPCPLCAAVWSLSISVILSAVIGDTV